MKNQIALTLVFTLAACTDGGQVVARHVDAGGKGDVCSWRAEEFAHSMPIRHVNGEPSHFKVTFDAQRREFVFVFKPDSRPSSTQLLLQRFSEQGVPTTSPVELQREIPPLRALTHWNHRLTGLLWTGHGHLAIWSQRSSPQPGEVRSELWAQRILDDSPLDTPQRLIDVEGFVDARTVRLIGDQLLVASVEDEGGTSTDLTSNPTITLRHFGSDLSIQGTPLIIPEQDLDATPWLVSDINLAGDEAHGGLLFSTLHADGAHSTFALIAGQQLVDVSTEPLTGPDPWATSALGYGKGRFLRCSSSPGDCRLVEAVNRDALGTPVAFAPPGGEQVNAIRWHEDRFWIGATSANGPARRMLGWVDAAGQWGYQPVWGDPSRTLGSASSLTLHPRGSDEIFWIDNFLSAGGLEELNILLHLTRNCPR
ncbi:MAG: hypothetical protein JRH20_04805 [Deltaproteobacteria bacterium]|nr:hypothetical protein [Deltaproteobacteria bacterium]